MKLRRPCDNCPWRVDAPREHWDPQHFHDIANNRAYPVDTQCVS